MTPIRIVFRAARDATGEYMSSWRCLPAEEAATPAPSPVESPSSGLSLGAFCEWPLRGARDASLGGDLDRLSHA